MTSSITTIADILRVHAAARPDAEVLAQDDRRQSWQELFENAKAVANGLATSGVGNQDRIAFLDKNSIEHFEVFFGAALINAVCVDVNWRLAPPEVEYIVNDADAKVLVVGPDFVPVLDAIGDRLDTVALVLVVGGHERFTDYATWLASQDRSDPGTTASDDDVAFQLYSSGTTGLPKGVMITNNNFFGLLPLAEGMWEIGPESVNLVAMPLFHIGGGGWAVAGMYVGARSVIMRDIDPARLIQLIGDEQVTHAFIVPALLQFLLMVPGVNDADLSSLQVVVYGASPISEEVLTKSIEVFGCKFWQAYGLTETTGAIVNLPPEDHDPTGAHRNRLRSCGLPGPGVELRIVDPDGETDLPVGEVGEIWVRSPQVMKGYWKQPDATATAIDADGWFRSGDAGYLDSDGYLYIHDRMKDMIVSGGENVYPAEVENVLMSHPAVADAAVIGVPDERWGETAKAIVVKQPGSDPAGDELIAYCLERIAKFKCPTSVDFVDTLPRNPSGKVLKKDLRAPYWEGRERFVQ